MSRTRMLVRLLQGAALLCVPLIFTNMAQAGTVILEGSDAITFHCGSGTSGGACTYEAQVWKALEGPSSKAIAVIDGSVPIALNNEGTGITIDNFASVAAAAAFGSGGLSQYAAVYFEGDGGDNEGPSGDTAILADTTGLTKAYVSGGGTVMIEDYAGSAAWDSIVGTSGGAPSGSVDGSFATGFVCSDNETVTALGTANGFTQPPAIGCWEHQAYNESFFGSLATPFSLSFFDAAPDIVGGATTGWSGLLSTGVTLTGAAPEPGTLLLLAVGLIGVFVLAGRRSRRPLVRVAA